MSVSGKGVLKRVDWLSILIFVLLVAIGWINIYSSTYAEGQDNIFDFSTIYGKQLIFIALAPISIMSKRDTLRLFDNYTLFNLICIITISYISYNLLYKAIEIALSTALSGFSFLKLIGVLNFHSPPLAL